MKPGDWLVCPCPHVTPTVQLLGSYASDPLTSGSVRKTPLGHSCQTQTYSPNACYFPPNLGCTDKTLVSGGKENSYSAITRGCRQVTWPSSSSIPSPRPTASVKPRLSDCIDVRRPTSARPHTHRTHTTYPLLMYEVSHMAHRGAVFARYDRPME